MLTDEEQRRITRERARRNRRHRQQTINGRQVAARPGQKSERQRTMLDRPEYNQKSFPDLPNQKTEAIPQKEIPYERYFVILCLIFGCLFVFLTPPLQASDEVTHFLKSYSLSRLQFVQRVEDGTVVDTLDSEAIAFSQAFGGLQYNSNAKISLSAINQWGSVYTTDSAESSQTTTYITVNSYIIYYIPQALGMAFARLLHMSILWTLFMGRLFNLLFYVFVMYHAIKTTPVAKTLFFLLALTPMAVFQAGSLSYDVMVISVCTLYTSHMLRLIFDPEFRLESKEFVLIFILSCSLLFLKVVYFPLILLMLAIPEWKFVDRKDRRTTFFQVLITGLIVFVFVMVIRKIIYAGVKSENDISLSQIISAVSDPKFFFEMIRNTFKVFGSNFSEEFIGKLGWLDTSLPKGIISLYYVMLIIGLFQFSAKEKKLANQIRPDEFARALILTVIAIIGFVVLLFAIFYFVTTLVTLQQTGSTVAYGIQGRYFIPISFLAFSIAAFAINYRVTIVKELYSSLWPFNIAIVVFVQIVSIVVMCLRYYGG